MRAKLSGMDRVSKAVLGILAADVVIAIAIAASSNTEGILGGVFYLLLYAVPLALLALMLRAPQSSLVTAAGILALVLAIFYVVIPIGNWGTYASSWESGRAVLATGLAVAGCIVVAWTSLSGRRRRRYLEIS